MTKFLTLCFLALLLPSSLLGKTTMDERTADLALEKKIQALEKELEEIKFQNHLKSRVKGTKTPTKTSDLAKDTVIEGPQDEDLQMPEVKTKTSFEDEQDQEKPLDTEVLKKENKKAKKPAILPEDETLDAQEGDPVSSKTTTPAEEPALEADAESEQATHYRQGRYYLSQQNSKLARKAFDSVLEKHDGTPEAVLAQFWIGEMMLAEKNYAGASLALGQAYGHLRVLSAKKNVVGDIYHGESDRLPEILAKLAYSLQMVNKKKEACIIIGQLRKDYKKISPTLEWYVGNLSRDLKCKKG